MEAGFRSLERLRLLVSLQKEEATPYEDAIGQIHAEKSVQGTAEPGLLEQTRGFQNCEHQTLRNGGAATTEK